MNHGVMCGVFDALVIRWQAVKKETSGQFRKALRAVVRCVYPATYFAQVPYLKVEVSSSCSP